MTDDTGQAATTTTDPLKRQRMRVTVQAQRIQILLISDRREAPWQHPVRRMLTTMGFRPIDSPDQTATELQQMSSFVERWLEFWPSADGAFWADDGDV